jgi:hypothetical protein
MKKTYNLLSNIEPTEDQLNLIMIDVLKNVNIRAKKGKEKFDLLQKNQINEVFEKYKNYSFQNANK